jgi:hypothetical protein
MLSRDEMQELMDSGLADDTYWDKKVARRRQQSFEKLGYELEELQTLDLEGQVGYLTARLDSTLNEFKHQTLHRTGYHLPNTVATREADRYLQQAYGMVETIIGLRMEIERSKYVVAARRMAEPVDDIVEDTEYNQQVTQRPWGVYLAATSEVVEGWFRTADEAQERLEDMLNPQGRRWEREDTIDWEGE